VAGKSATLAIKIVSDAKGATAGLAEVEGKVGGFQQKLDRASVAAGGLLVGIGAVAQEAYQSASALEQSGGAVESVFGQQAAAIKGLAEGAAQAVGLSTNSYQELASVLGAQLGGMGYEGQKLTDQTDSLITMGADLAATFGGSTSDAVSALSSLMRGERDPIERYGIALNQAAVDARVAAMGLDTSTPAAKRAAEAQATLAIVAEQGAAAQGAFARESDTAAGQTQRASAEFENAKAALGDVLLPIVAAAAQKLSALAGWLVRKKDVIVPLVAIVGGLAAGIIGLNAAMRAYSTVQTIVNAVINASPLMRLVLIITGIIAIVVAMYNKFDWFRDIVDAIGSALSWAFDGARSAIEWVIDKLSWIGDAASWVGDLFSASGTVSITPVASGGLSGMFGSSASVAAAGPVYGAPMTALAGGGPSSRQGPGGGTVIVNVHDSFDPIATGRQLERILRKYAQATGNDVALQIGGRAK
jgi:hypothetical protein